MPLIIVICRGPETPGNPQHVPRRVSGTAGSALLGSCYLILLVADEASLINAITDSCCIL